MNIPPAHKKYGFIGFREVSVALGRIKFLPASFNSLLKAAMTFWKPPLKGQGHGIRMAWKCYGKIGLNYYILLSDISLNFVKCPFNILFIFKILVQGKRIVIEFHEF